MRLLTFLTVVLGLQVASWAQTTLSTALDNSALTWRTGGNAAWFGTATVSHDGADAAQSGRILEGQQTWLETTVTGPGIVAFWWKASSEGSCDFLEFSIGSTLKASISAEFDWKRTFFFVPAGAQTLRWRYFKDIGTDLGSDGGWVDEVVYTPLSGPPAMVVQPLDRTVVAGATLTIQAAVAGAAPLSYQWYFNQTNALPGATGSTLTLTAIQATQAGDYRLAASNTLGSLVSAPTFVSVVSKEPAENVLLFSDGSFPNAFITAMNNTGRAYQSFGFSSLLAFNRAVRSAHPGKTLVIVDAYNYANDFADVLAFIQDGGRAIVQYWYLGASGGKPSLDLANALNATVSFEKSSPSPLYKWTNSPMFTGLSLPLSFQDTFNINGQSLNWTASGDPVGGYVGSRTAGQAAIIVGNAGRTILNGFFLEEALSSTSAARLAQNEIEYLVGPPVISPPTITTQPRSQKAVTGGSLTLVGGAGGTGPLTYRWFRNETEAVAGGTGPTLALSAITPAMAGRYRLVVTNLQGSATSDTALVTVNARGAVSQVLVLADLADTSPYRDALNGAGWQHALFSTEVTFNTALQTADPATTLAVMDAPKYGHDVRDLVAYIKAGGRALVQYWNIGGESTLAAALGVSVVGTFNSPLPVYHWGEPGMFTGVSNPLMMTETEFTIDGQRLQPASGANAVAGFAPNRSTVDAAVVLANGGFTIVNGLTMEESVDRSEGIRFIQNEVATIAGAPPATMPFIQVQPQDTAVVFHGTARFTVTAGGTAPLSYQWFFNDTPIQENGSGPMLEITNVQPAQLGSYTVAISNPAGSRTSARAFLRGSPLAPVEEVILFADDTNRISPFATALANLSLPYRAFTTENSFESALAAAAAESKLAIVDCSIQPAELKVMEAFARSGGRVILQFWGLTQKYPMMEVFDIEVAQPMSIVPPVYGWGNCVLFNGLDSPLELIGTALTTEGMWFRPAPGCWAVAGYQPSATDDQAALLVGNGGRTIVNGFFLKEASPGSAGVRLAQNEIEALLALDTEADVSASAKGERTGEGAFKLRFAGATAARYAIHVSEDLKTWDRLGFAVETGPGQFEYVDADASTHETRFYRVARDN